MRWSCAPSCRETALICSCESFRSRLSRWPYFRELAGNVEVWRASVSLLPTRRGTCDRKRRIAARTLGWRMLLLDGVADDTIAALLGLDRHEDFERAEREHPDCIAVVCPTEQARGRATGQTISVPLSIAPDALRERTRHAWHGKANRLSRDEPVLWEVINQVEHASWKSSTERRGVELNHDRPSDETRINHDPRATSIHSDPLTAGQVIRQRRSALAFDGKTSISAGRFFTMLAPSCHRLSVIVPPPDALGRPAWAPATCPVHPPGGWPCPGSLHAGS